MKLRTTAFGIVAAVCLVGSTSATAWPAATTADTTCKVCTVRGKVVGAPPAKGKRIAFAGAVPLETGVPSRLRLKSSLAYKLSAPPRPTILSATVIDLGAQRIYGGRSKSFVPGGPLRKDVRVRLTSGPRKIASSTHATASAASPNVVFEVRRATLRFPEGHTGNVLDWIATLVSGATLPCRFEQTSEHDPRVVEARRIEKALQDKGQTSTRMDFSKILRATNNVSASVTVGPDSGGSFQGSATFMLTSAKSGKSLGSKTVSGRFTSLDAFERAMQQALDDLLSRACGFELDFDTVHTWTVFYGSAISHVRVSNLALNADNDFMNVKPLDYASFQFFAPCPVIPTSVPVLPFQASIKQFDPVLIVEISAGTANESLTALCPDAPPTPVPLPPLYTSAMSGLHGVSPFTIADWEMPAASNGVFFARRTYARSTSTGGGSVAEQTTFVLRYAP
jgi:hypothetical protein